MKYRKKPVVIEAYQTDKEMDIETLEGTMHASVGDYIITGVRGEQYPCKPDIFKQTYEPADAPTASPWHRVEEGLPEPLVRCLIWDGHEVDVAYFVRGFYNSKTDWYWRKAGINRKGGKIPHREVKMWMPIEPPQEDA